MVSVHNSIRIAIFLLLMLLITPEGVTRELGDRADNGLGPYTSLIKAAFMGGFTG
jgi:hypothetical protein